MNLDRLAIPLNEENINSPQYKKFLYEPSMKNYE